jgi:hypothetical protein
VPEEFRPPDAVEDLLGLYNLRVRMAKLGYTSPLEELDCFTASVFAVLSVEIDRIESEAMKAKES